MNERYQPMRECPELLGKAIQPDVGAMVDNLKDSIEVMEHLQAVMIHKGQQPMSEDQVSSHQGLDNWMMAAATNLGSMYADCCRARALADILARESPEDSPPPPMPEEDR